MRVLVTGANGFIAKNLRAHLTEREDLVVTLFTREHKTTDLYSFVSEADFIFHLAGVNRPQHESEFTEGNVTITQVLCDAVVRVFAQNGKQIPILYTSSVQAERDNAYGVSKKAAEELIFDVKRKFKLPVYIFRLPNVFGKWCRPNYNSMIATFCHNVPRGLPIEIHNRLSTLTLVYIDDVVNRFIQLMEGAESLINDDGFELITPTYLTTVGEVADLIFSFKSSRDSLVTERVGTGLMRTLYATYLSYLPKELFSYKVKQYPDQRGIFVEMLKTQDSGQFSFFTAKPGITRGGHYHHTKTEKFLIIQGKARYRFKNIDTGEYYELVRSGEDAEIIETIPGWTHDITNIGDSDLIVMLWANEIFDRLKPDTYMCPIQPN